jgi:hypothetical protein
MVEAAGQREARGEKEDRISEQTVRGEVGTCVKSIEVAIDDQQCRHSLEHINTE